MADLDNAIACLDLALNSQTHDGIQNVDAVDEAREIPEYRMTRCTCDDHCEGPCPMHYPDPNWNCLSGLDHD